MKSYQVTTLFLALMMALGACTLPSAATPTEKSDVNAVFTAAAQTVEVKLTQNALTVPTNPAATATLQPPSAVPPATNTPIPQVAIPSLTPQPVVPVVAPTAACDAAQFVTDVTIPDGTAFGKSATFTKTWRLKNIGTCTWNSSYALFFDSGDQMGGPSSVHLATTTAPGQTVDVSVNLQAPSSNGSFTGYWGLINAAGTRFPIVGGFNGRSFSVVINVGTAGTSGGTTTASGTETSAKFAVTSIGFSVTQSGSCSSVDHKYIVTVHITVNKAGTVTYTWYRSDGDKSTSSSMVFTGAGSQDDTYTWQTTLNGAWIDLYVDKPNHYQYGRANLNCP